MSFPPIMWAIFALGLVFLVLRVWAGRADERRRAAHEERMARLLAEREEARQAEPAPHSLAALTSDAAQDERGPQPASASASPAEAIKVRCRACKALNDESKATCERCGAEL